MKRLMIVAFAIALAIAAHAQTLTVTGEVTRHLKLTLKDLEKYPSKELKVKDRDGKEHTYKGTLLATVLDSAGVTLGKDLRGENLAKYVLITAADNYQVVYSLAEIDPELTNNTVLVATHVDGNLLPKGEGPFRLVNPIDKRPARWMREITTIEVAFAKH